MALPLVHRYSGAVPVVSAGLLAVSLFTGSLLFIMAPSGLPVQAAYWRTPQLIIAHLVGDLLLWSAFTIIPFLILYFMFVGHIHKANPVTFPAITGWGAIFLWACGQSFLLDALETWYQIQWPRVIVKWLAGGITWVFVVLLVRHRLRLMAVARAISRASEVEVAVSDEEPAP